MAQITVTPAVLRETAQALANEGDASQGVISHFLSESNNLVGAGWQGDAAQMGSIASQELHDGTMKSNAAQDRLREGLLRAAALMERQDSDAKHQISSVFGATAAGH